MNPDQPNQVPNTPPPQPSAAPQQPYMSAQPAATPVARPKKSIKLPIILMAWPAVTMILIFALTIVTNMLSSDTPGSLFGPDSTIKTVVNVLLFLSGTVVVLGGPVSFIIGLVLLVVRKTKA